VDAFADVQECEQLSARIVGVRNLPTVATDQEEPSGEITGLVEAAATSAGIPAAKLLDIVPQPPARVGDSDYKEKATQVTLKDVTLEQVVKLMHGVVTGRRGLRAKWLRLDARSGEEGGSPWTAEFGLTYMIYDPPRTDRK